MPNSVVLHFGFVNTPYNKETISAPMASAKIEAKRKLRRGFTKTMTAEGVSKILEGKYNMISMFSKVYEEEIKETIHSQFRTEVMNALTERRKLASPRLAQYMKPKTDMIEKMFRQFLDNEEMEGPGIPTQAALMGKRRGRISRTPRPSFIDTGIYRASFRAWVDLK